MIFGLRPTKVGILLFIASIILNVLLCIHAVLYTSPAGKFIGPFPPVYFYFWILMILSIVVYSILGFYLTKGGE